MKITLGPLSFDILLFLRLCLPATLFIGLCMGIFLPFDPVLLLIDQIAPPARLNLLIGTAWLSLLILYILLEVVFSYVAARLLRRSFGLETWHIQKRTAILSGLPFYALSLLCLWATIVGILSDEDPVAVYASGIGFLGLAFVSCSYPLLLRFFLRRSTAIAHNERNNM